MESDKPDRRTERDIRDLQQHATFVTTGIGAPQFTPERGRVLYIRQDGGVGTTLYVWEGAAWVAK